MVTWMSTHSDGLSALAGKIDNFETLLQAAEKSHCGSRTSLSNPVLTGNTASSSNWQKDLHFGRRGTWLPVTQWPKAIQLLSKAGIYFDEGYVMSVEDRPILRLRPIELGKSDIGSEGSVSSETKNTILHDIPARFSTGAAISVDLDYNALQSLFDGFLDHIDTLYSFLDREQMQALFHHFVLEYSTVRLRSGDSVESKVPDSRRPVKRKRTESLHPNYGKSRVERSPDNAIVLFALALGEVTKHQGRLPSTSDPLAPFTYSSEHESLRPIPGIGYFAAAINIIGDHMDGHDLIHAQLFLLAGMYKAQLARVKEASSWYCLAGRVLTHLVHRRHLYHEEEAEKMTQSAPKITFHSIQPYRSSQDDLILRATWACLQLEDEILPELRLPPSGLQKLKDALLLPIPAANGTCMQQSKWPEVDAEERRQLIYTAELQLRRTLNHVQRHLFTDQCLILSYEEINQSFRHHAAALQRWRSQLASQLRWDDSDTPPRNLLQARLQHAYWEAKLTILRPFLYYTLHKELSTGDGKGAKHGMSTRHRTDHTDHLFAAIDIMSQTSGDQEIQSLAELCVEAVKQSLKTYDGISERLIVSNIQSVAHGHFDNMLVLMAAYHSEGFSDSISIKELEKDLKRTTGVLAGLSPISPTAAADCSILEGAGRNLFLLR